MRNKFSCVYNRQLLEGYDIEPQRYFFGMHRAVSRVCAKASLQQSWITTGLSYGDYTTNLSVLTNEESPTKPASATSGIKTKRRPSYLGRRRFLRIFFRKSERILTNFVCIRQKNRCRAVGSGGQTIGLNCCSRHSLMTS